MVGLVGETRKDGFDLLQSSGLKSVAYRDIELFLDPVTGARLAITAPAVRRGARNRFLWFGLALGGLIVLNHLAAGT